MRGMIIVVNGRRCAGSTTVYQLLKERAPKAFERIRFAFPGNPFGESGLTHPVAWSAEEADLPATARLLQCWADLHAFCAKEVVEPLEHGAVVVLDRFGLDAFIYATAGAGAREFDETSRVHHGLVKLLLKEPGLPLPQYLYVQASDERIEGWMRDAALAGGDSQLSRHEYLRHERTALQKYFDGTGQKPPLFLDADDRTHDELCEDAILLLAGCIRKHLAEETAAA